MKLWQARLGLLVIAIIWAFGYIATADSLNYMKITQMQVFRFGISVLILVIIFYKRVFQMNKRALFYGSILGVVFFIGMTLHSVALEYTSVSRNAFIIIFNIVFVPILMRIFFKVKIQRYYIYGLITMLFGFVFLIFGVDIFNLKESIIALRSELTLNFGDLLTFISAFIFAVHIVLIGHFVSKEDPIKLVVVQITWAGIFSFIYSIIMNDPIFSIDSTILIPALPAIIYLGVSGSIGFAGQLVLQQYMPSSNVAVIFSTEALFAALFSITLGFEPFTSSLLIGAILITFGLIWTETGFKFKEK